MTVARTFEKCRPIFELKVMPYFQKFRVNFILSAHYKPIPTILDSIGMHAL